MGSDEEDEGEGEELRDDYEDDAEDADESFGGPPQTKRKKPNSGKLCCRGQCPCRRPVGKTGKTMPRKMQKRRPVLELLFGADEGAWLPQLLLPAGTGEGKLGDVRVCWEHYPRDELKVSVSCRKCRRPASTDEALPTR